MKRSTQDSIGHWAERPLRPCTSRQKPIWVVGGTGLYIKTLTQGLFASPRIEPRIRENLKQEAKAKGADCLYQRLREVDPVTASKHHPHDLVRTIRALEVFDATGIPISFFREQHRFGERPYLTLKIGVELERDDLYRRIDERVDRMIEEGFLQEVERLLEMGYGPELNPMQSLGYKQMVRFIRKEMGWDEAVLEIKRDTRRYAKRQWTWFKSDAEVCWRNGRSDRHTILQEVRAFLKEETRQGSSTEGVRGHDEEPGEYSGSVSEPRSEGSDSCHDGINPRSQDGRDCPQFR